jgi:transposase-like protein
MPVNPFKWKHYEGEIILLNVRWYSKYPLSYRNLKEMVTIQPMQNNIIRYHH